MVSYCTSTNSVQFNNSIKNAKGVLITLTKTNIPKMSTSDDHSEHWGLFSHRKKEWIGGTFGSPTLHEYVQSFLPV